MALPRQIMSVNGIPVQIVEFPSKKYGDIVSLCVGEPTTLGKLMQEFDEATSEDFQTINSLDPLIYERTRENVRRTDPQLYEAWTDTTDSKCSNNLSKF